MAQRKRAGLITPRSLDRNGLPVLLFFYFLIPFITVHFSFLYLCFVHMLFTC